MRPSYVPIRSIPDSPLVDALAVVAKERRQILIRHPQYPDSDNTLLKLFAPDHPDGGLHFNYVMVVCGIITGNKWDGWLTESRKGDRVVRELDEILPCGAYYLQRENSSVDSPYPIVPSFRAWMFPHKNLPPGWTDVKFPNPLTQALAASRAGPLSGTNLLSALRRRDGTCRVTGCVQGAQAAYLCPPEEAEWYKSNGMYQYHNTKCPMRSNPAEDTANSLLLRADLRVEFDKRAFVFIPKADRSVSESPKLVTHLLDESIEYELLYHNRPLQELSFVSPEILLARLAWSIFPLLPKNGNWELIKESSKFEPPKLENRLPFLFSEKNFEKWGLARIKGK